jgi:phosphoribosylamine--glycine ligase
LDNFDAVIEFVRQHDIELTVVGPEAPLVAGLVDAFTAEGLTIFGPTAAAAQLEGSKAFSKDFLQRHQIPTAAYAVFTEVAPALAYIEQQGAPIVVKADGLAAGKGVILAQTKAEAEIAVRDMLSDNRFGTAGSRVVIEEFLQGEEVSFIVMVDGLDVLPMATSQDHKAAFDGDQGPNTGGMGAYSPAPVMNDAVTQKALSEIIQPTMDEMARRGTPFQGVLFCGLMIQNGQPRLVEYNVRFGDPECQVMMMRLGAQALDLMLACAEGRLAGTQVHWADDHALTVVMAANGYPGDYAKGSVIGGLEALTSDSFQMCFHAGTARDKGQFVANGGRVLNVTARGTTLAEAQARAYGMVDAIDWPGGFCRRDIGWRAL